MESNERQLYILDIVINDICRFLELPCIKNNIIRIHTKKLEQLGDISFPLNIKNWYNYLNSSEGFLNIFDYIASRKTSSKNPQLNLERHIDNLKCESEKWALSLANVEIRKDNVHLYFRRCKAFEDTIRNCLDMKSTYGALYDFPKVSCSIADDRYNETGIDLLSLRLITLKKVTQNLADFKLNNAHDFENIDLCFSKKKTEGITIICGQVIESKKTCTKAEELIEKRSIDMRLMAEHKYGLRVKSSEQWKEYFRKLGEASITIELLQNKPHKNIKISLNDLTGANKGASFIFYNSARLAVLLETFEKQVDQGKYPKLASIEKIDFTLLNQPEEWELLYVYIMQYPQLIHSCLRDVEKGVVNPHYLVSFLSNLCSLFSGYYRRVRILMTPKPHLIATIHARIYLLKCLEQVLHNTLKLLNIDPIRQM